METNARNFRLTQHTTNRNSKLNTQIHTCQVNVSEAGDERKRESISELIFESPANVLAFRFLLPRQAHKFDPSIRLNVVLTAFQTLGKYFCWSKIRGKHMLVWLAYWMICLVVSSIEIITVLSVLRWKFLNQRYLFALSTQKICFILKIKSKIHLENETKLNWIELNWIEILENETTVQSIKKSSASF